MKLQFIFFFFNLLTIPTFAQKIVEIKIDNNKYSPLARENKMFLWDKDSVLLDSSIMSFSELQLIGRCNGWNEPTCGILNLSMFAENTARARGYNAVGIKYYYGTDTKDTLGVVLYKLTNNEILKIEANKTGKHMILINPKSNTDKEVRIDDEKMTVAQGKHIKYAVKTDKITVKLGGGLLSSSAQLGFSKVKERYFIINGYQMTGAPRGIGLGVSAPTIMEVGEVTANTVIKYMNK